MVRRSAPASSRCVAYECLSVCGADATIDAGGLRGKAHRIPDALRRERPVGAPAVLLPGKRYVWGRIHR